MPSWIWLVFVALIVLFAWPSLERPILSRWQRWRRRKRSLPRANRP